MWSSYELLNMSTDIIYDKAVSVGSRLYLLGIDSRNNLKMAEVCLESLKCTEYVPINRENISSLGQRVIRTNVHVYDDQIIILIIDLIAMLPFKLLKINTITRQMNEIDVDWSGIQFVLNIADCCLNDQLCVLFITFNGPCVDFINLKTFKKSRIEVKHSNCLLDSSLRLFSSIAHGHNIYCFNIFKPDAFVYNIMNNKWTEIEIYDQNEVKYQIILNSVIGDEVFVFKKTIDKNGHQLRCVDVINLKTEEWRRTNFGFPFSIDDGSFCGLCVVNDKIIAFGNCKNVINQISMPTSDEEVDLATGNDKLKVYILDLKPF
ncbi:hypothetical protein CHUAL_006675 [Chamberlinius hualienensis]